MTPIERGSSGSARVSVQLLVAVQTSQRLTSTGCPQRELLGRRELRHGSLRAGLVVGYSGPSDGHNLDGGAPVVDVKTTVGEYVEGASPELPDGGAETQRNSRVVSAMRLRSRA